MVIHGEHSLHDLELLSQLKNILRNTEKEIHFVSAGDRAGVNI